MEPEQIDEFADFEATLQKINDILNAREAAEEDTKPKTTKAKSAEDFENLDVDNLNLTVRENRSLINIRPDEPPAEAGKPNAMDAQQFMQEVERDSNERAQSKAKREYEAEMQRCQGNEAFRKGNYEKAIIHYTKAWERVKDSPITFNNRALCYIRLRNYKRALTDCNHVLEKLQESNLRAWLYRATAYKHLEDTKNFEESIAKAREHNPQQLDYIERFIGQIDKEM